MCMMPRYSTLLELSLYSSVERVFSFSSWNFHQFMRKKKKSFHFEFFMKTQRKSFFFIALKTIEKFSLFNEMRGKLHKTSHKHTQRSFLRLEFLQFRKQGKSRRQNRTKRKSKSRWKSQLRKSVGKTHTKKVRKMFYSCESERASVDMWKFTSLKWNLFIYFSFFCFQRWKRKTFRQLLWHWFQRLSISFMEVILRRTSIWKSFFEENVCN